MSCLCKKTSLGFFIRNVVQIDLRCAARLVKRKNLVLSTNSTSTFQALARHYSLSNKIFPVTLSTESYNTPQSAHLQPSHHPPSSHQPPTQPDVSSFRTYSERKTGGSRRRTELEEKFESNTLSPESAVDLQVWENAIDVGKRNECESVGKNRCDGTVAGKPIFKFIPPSIKVLAAKPLKEKTYRFRARSRGDFMHDVLNKEKIKQQRQSPASSSSAAIKNPKSEFSENAVPFLVQREHWQLQKEALNKKFQDGWNPRKRLSPDALVGIRAINSQFPEQYTTSVLADKFQVSPESIRRILKSKWAPKADEQLARQRRWFSRGQKVWMRYAELGLKPPKKWRSIGIGKRERRRK